jgi:hypothetical protein
MSGVIHPLPQYAFMVWCSVKAQGQFYIYLSPETFGYTLAEFQNGPEAFFFFFFFQTGVRQTACSDFIS